MGTRALRICRLSLELTNLKFREIYEQAVTM